MSEILRIEKRNETLPSVLTPSTLYLVKAGGKVHLFVSDLEGNEAFSTSAGQLGDLANVLITTPNDTDVLTFDTEQQKWVAKSIPTETTFTRTDVLQVVNGVARYYPLKACTLSTMWGWVGLAPEGTPITFNLLKNGVVVATGNIATGLFQMNPQTNLNIPLDVNDYLTLNITAVGSTTPGSELRLRLQFN